MNVRTLHKKFALKMKRLEAASMAQASDKAQAEYLAAERDLSGWLLENGADIERALSAWADLEGDPRVDKLTRHQRRALKVFPPFPQEICLDDICARTHRTRRGIRLVLHNLTKREMVQESRRDTYRMAKDIILMPYDHAV